MTAPALSIVLALALVLVLALVLMLALVLALSLPQLTVPLARLLTCDEAVLGLANIDAALGSHD